MTWAPTMEASKSNWPCWMWQLLHWLSSICGRLTWLRPVAKFTSSWQEPQASRPGLVFQALDWVAALEWQVVQFRTSCGNTTLEKSDQAPRCQMRDGVPA